jgi:hypothetical protein
MPDRLPPAPLSRAAALCVLCVLVLQLAGCGGSLLREERHPDGSRKSSRTYALDGSGRETPHGIHLTWHPSGTWASLDVFVRGRRHGYALRWDEAGRLRSAVRWLHGRPEGGMREWDGSGKLTACRAEDGSDCLGTAQEPPLAWGRPG